MTLPDLTGALVDGPKEGTLRAYPSIHNPTIVVGWGARNAESQVFLHRLTVSNYLLFSPCFRVFKSLSWAL